MTTNSTPGMGRFSLARGLGMLFILGGHSAGEYMRVHEMALSNTSGGLFANWGNVFGGGVIAMFFMVSGYSYFQRSPKRTLHIQRKMLLMPYLWTAAAVLLTKVLLAIVERRSFLEHGGNLVQTYLLGLNGFGGAELFGFPVDTISILWFVLALFWAWNIYNLIEQIGSSSVRTLLICGCVAIGWAMTLVSSIWPYAIPMGLIAVGYLCCGRRIREHRLLDEKVPVWTLVLAGLVGLVCLAVGDVNVAECRWGMGLLDVAGSVAIGYLLTLLCSRVERRIPANGITNTVEAIGFYSMWILCLHGYEKVIFPWYKVAYLWHFGVLSFTFFCLVVRMLMIYVMYKIVQAGRRMVKQRR